MDPAVMNLDVNPNTQPGDGRNIDMARLMGLIPTQSTNQPTQPTNQPTQPTNQPNQTNHSSLTGAGPSTHVHPITTDSNTANLNLNPNPKGKGKEKAPESPDVDDEGTEGGGDEETDDDSEDSVKSIPTKAKPKAQTSRPKAKPKAQTSRPKAKPKSQTSILKAQGQAVTGKSRKILTGDSPEVMDVDGSHSVINHDFGPIQGCHKAIESFADDLPDDLVKDEEIVRTCSSCSDFGLLKQCARPGCPHSLCIAKTNHHPCISDVGEGEFWCPPCWRRGGSGELPYKVVRDTAHLLAHTRLPLVFHNIALKSNVYAAKMLTTQLDEEYASCKHLLTCTDIQLVNRGARVDKVRTRIRPARIFAQQYLSANLLVLVDTHSDYNTGQLVHSVSADGSIFWTHDAASVIRQYIGPEFWNYMMDMQGTKGAIILACGPAFTVREHFETIRELVIRYDSAQFNGMGLVIIRSSGQFHFVVGFTAHSVQPSKVMPFVLRLMVAVYIEQVPIELAVEKELLSWSLLAHTPVVLVCQTGGKKFMSEKFLASTDGLVWGLNAKCGGENCSADGSSIKTIFSKHQRRHEVVKFQCKACNSQSTYISKPDWVVPLRGNDLFFHHPFPLSQEQEDYIHLTWRRREQGQQTFH